MTIRWNEVSVGKKITSVFVAMLILIVSVGVWVYVLNNEIAQEARDVQEETVIFTEYAHQMRVDVIQIQQWLTDISATRGLDGLNDGFDEAEKSYQSFMGLLEKFEARHTEANDQEQISNTQNLKISAIAYYDMGKRMAQSYIDAGPAGGNQMMAQFDAAAANMYEALDPFLEAQITEMEHKISTISKDADTLNNGIIIVFLIALMITVAGALVIYRTVTRPLQSVMTMMIDIAAGKKDLTKRLHELSSKDELGVLVHEFNVFMDILQETIRTITNSTTNVSETVDEMGSTTDRANRGVSEQRTETDQVATAMTEMVATVQEVARSAETAASAAREADQESSNGRNVVTLSMEAINTLASDVQSAADVIGQLASESDQISTVLDVIKGIAEQTNLLALNAAIEAARAGEQGRGFAVVADEVRTLAQRTHQSTQEIEDMIGKLQSSASRAVSVMEKGSKQASISVEHAGKAVDSLGAITNSVTTIADLNTQIASAAEEQSAVANEINNNVQNITQIAEQTSTNISETASTGKELSRVAMELNDIVVQFKV